MRARSRLPLLAAALILLSGAAVLASPEPSKKDRLAALSEEERKWLEEYVAPIILPEEEKLFLQLSEPHQREIFKEEFWKRREKTDLPVPMGPGYRYRYEELRRRADEEYDGWRQDAGRMVIRFGEPASIKKISDTCAATFRDLEIWTYANSAQGRSAVRHFFYRPVPLAARRLWQMGTSESDVFTPGSCRKSFESLAADCSPQLGDPCASSSCRDGCEVFQAYSEIRSRQGSPLGGAADYARLLAVPAVSTEGLEQLAGRFPGVANPKAKTLSVEGPSSKPAAAPTRTELLAAMPEEERKWVTEFAAPIILPEEEKLFLDLTAPHQREIFKEEFWKRREQENLPAPLGPGYRSRYEEWRKLADEKYDGWRQDAGRMVIRFGEPASIEMTDLCGETLRGVEIWTFNNLGSSGRGVQRYLFYRPFGAGPRKLWNLSIPESDLFNPVESGPKTLAAMAGNCRLSPGGLNPAEGDRTSAASREECLCHVYLASQEIRTRQGSPGGAAVEIAKLQEPPKIPTEGLDQLRGRFAIADGKAKPLSVEGPSAPGTSASPQSVSPAVHAASTPAPARRKLSGKEVKELTARLDPKYRQFLQLVELIVTDDERQVFLQIVDDYQKDRFIESFWRRRSVDRQGIRTDYEAIHTRRVETALEQFKNLHNDRAKILIINGAPDAIVPIDCQDVYVPIQIWYYDRIEALKSKVYLIFYQPYGIGEYKLWLPLDGEGVLQVGGGPGGGIASQRGIPRRNEERCQETRTLRQAMSFSAAVLGSGAMGLAGTSKLFEPPIIETEGVDQILSMTTELAAGSAALGVTKLLRFPEARANKIAVDVSLLVPKADLAPRDLADEKFYNVDIVGEVVKGERLIDNFKYRFDIPIDEVGGDKIPLTVRRYLYPGEYNLVLKVSDGNQNAEGRISEKLTVPEQPDAPPPLVAAARAEVRSAVENAKEAGLVASAISLLPVAKEIVTGLQRFETKVAEGIRAVDFYLNGTKVMTKTRPPFDADLNLGPMPRKHTVRVIAYGPSGRPVGEDEYIVNEGREVFRVRILSPEKGSKAAGPTKVVAAVAVPEGKALQKVEFFSNESRVATLYQPPFEQTVNVKSAKTLGYVRVVGTLEDGTVSEDVRYVNAPDYISEVTVDAVELYTSVTERGHPVQGLQASNFKVFEDGAIQKIESFEFVKNLPVSVGIVLDTSASMLEALPAAQKAALAFLDFSIGPKDRAFTVSFDNEPYLLSKPTNRKDKLFRSLAGLRAEGSTALYDAIIYGLYQFTGIKGKKALVILSDGKDTASKFDFDTTLEYVRKAGIQIYGIGLGISGADLEVKYKLNKLAQGTGGQTFYVDTAKNLESIYRQINDDLRSQYLLTYYSTNTSGKEKWRKVEVKVEPSNLQARTLSGYYP